MPKKLNILELRVLNERLPTKLNLQKRGVISLSNICPLCDQADEDEAHLFFCSVSRHLLTDLGTWWGTDISGFLSFRDVLSWCDSSSLKPLQKQGFLGAVLTYFWLVWKMRNGKTFPNSKSVRDNIAPGELQALSFFWIKNRVNNCKLVFSWMNWCLSPLGCL